MDATVEVVAEALAESEFEQFNVWNTLPHHERNDFRAKARNIVELIDAQRGPSVDVMALPPDPADPVPHTIGSIIERVRQVMGVSRANIINPSNNPWHTRSRQVCVILCLKHMDPKPPIKVLATAFNFHGDEGMMKSIRGRKNCKETAWLVGECERTMNVPTQRPVPSDTEGRVGEGSLRDCERETLAGL